MLTGTEIMTGTGIAAILIGGVGTIMKTRFLTKKEHERRQNGCQRNLIARIDGITAKQETMHKEQIANMVEIKEFMGKVNYHIERTNGKR